MSARGHTRSPSAAVRETQWCSRVPSVFRLKWRRAKGPYCCAWALSMMEGIDRMIGRAGNITSPSELK